MHKAERRQQCLQWRHGLSPQLHSQLSDQICQHLSALLAQRLSPGDTVLAYYPHRREPDIRLLLAIPNYRWALPRCLPERQMAWHYWQPGESLLTSSYGIQEPDPALPLATSSSAVLVPALAMDRLGYRLGYGGGYFDRLLATPALGDMLTVGITFDAMLLTRLEIDDWDYPLGAVCTESGVFATK